MTNQRGHKSRQMNTLALLILAIGSSSSSQSHGKDKPKSKSTFEYKALPFTYEKLMSKKLKSEFPNVEVQTNSVEMRKSAAGTATFSVTKNKKGELTLLTLLMVNRPNQMSANADSAAYFIEEVTGSIEEGLDFYAACLERLKSKGELTKQHNGFILKCSGSAPMPRINVQVEDNK
jgi:hypothetical protein